MGLLALTYIGAIGGGTVAAVMSIAEKVWAGNGNGNGNGGGNGGSNGNGNGGGNGGGNNGGGNNGGGNNGGSNNGGTNNGNHGTTNNGKSGTAPGQTGNKGKNGNGGAAGTAEIDTTPIGPAGSPAIAAGNGIMDRAVAHEIVITNAGAAIQDFANANGMNVLSQQNLGALNISVTRVAVPDGVTLAAARAKIKAAFPQASVDYNHIYRPQVSLSLPARSYANKQIKWTPQLQGCNSASLGIGMLDTLVDQSAPLLRDANITQQQFLDEAGDAAAATDHGSIVASLLAGQMDFGLLPHAALSVAGIFGVDSKGEPIASATSFVAGLNWLAERGIKTVNTSLSGPDNGLVALAVAAANAQGIQVVAAVGNDGLDGAERFPAAYPGVLGVTAIDFEKHPYALANRGTFVALAAPGVDLWVPSAGKPSSTTYTLASGEGSFVSGTSFAAPFVAAALAANGNDVEDLLANAVDLGAAGKDPIYGHGLVQAALGCSVAER